jgi:hypothetical protein
MVRERGGDRIAKGRTILVGVQDVRTLPLLFNLSADLKALTYI